MPPKKAAAADAADPPRRSGRIASQPVVEAIPKPKAKKVTKKRTAGDELEVEDGEGSTAKKVLNFFFFLPFFWAGYIY